LRSATTVTALARAAACGGGAAACALARQPEVASFAIELPHIFAPAQARRLRTQARRSRTPAVGGVAPRAARRAARPAGGSAARFVGSGRCSSTPGARRLRRAPGAANARTGVRVRARSDAVLPAKALVDAIVCIASGRVRGDAPQKKKRGCPQIRKSA
jgi:hypothetical protein